MIKEENIEIKDKETAMELAKTFVLIHTSATILFLDRVSDIKLYINARGKPRFQKEIEKDEELKDRIGNLYFSNISDNSLFTREELTLGKYVRILDSIFAPYEHTVKPPVIEQVNTDYKISMFTFNSTGRLTQWSFVVHANGTMEWERKITFFPLFGPR